MKRWGLFLVMVLSVTVVLLTGVSGADEKISGPGDGGKKAVHEGTYENTGGTGRFERTMGKGTFKGEQLGSRETGGDQYNDFTGTEWKK